MTMRIAYIKPHGDKEVGDTEWLARKDAIRLWAEKIVVPATEWEAEHPPVDTEAEDRAEKKKKKLVKKKQRGRPKKKALSRKAEARETAI